MSQTSIINIFPSGLWGADRNLQSVAKGLGYRLFNVSDDSHSVDRATAQLIEEFYTDVPVQGS